MCFKDLCLDGFGLPGVCTSVCCECLLRSAGSVHFGLPGVCTSVCCECVLRSAVSVSVYFGVLCVYFGVL